MNVYLYELKNNFKYYLIWTFSIVMLATITIGFYPILKDDLAYFITMMDNFPPAIKALFGIKVDTIDNITGFYATLPITFIMLSSSISATIMGVSILSKEIREKTVDFLYAKPISRFDIIKNKILAVLTLLTISHIIFFVTSLLTIVVVDNNVHLLNFILLNISIYIVALVFFTIGLFISSLFNKLKNPNSVSLSIIFAFYALTAFGDDKMRLIVPFKYFDNIYIITNQSYELSYLLLSFIVMICMLCLTFRLYLKKDLSTV